MVVAATDDDSFRQTRFTASVFDARVGRSLVPLSDSKRNHELWINATRFSPDGMRVVTAGQDLLTNVWNASTGAILYSLVNPYTVAKPRKTISDNGPFVESAFFSPSGARLFVAMSDGIVRIWDAIRGLLLMQTDHNSVEKAEISRDGKYLVELNDSHLTLWNVNPDMSSVAEVQKLVDERVCKKLKAATELPISIH